MPLYEYECDTCGHRFEVIQKFSDTPLTECPKCQGPVRKLFVLAGHPVQGVGLLHHRLRQEERHGRGIGQGRGLGLGLEFERGVGREVRREVVGEQQLWRCGLEDRQRNQGHQADGNVRTARTPNAERRTAPPRTAGGRSRAGRGLPLEQLAQVGAELVAQVGALRARSTSTPSGSPASSPCRAVCPAPRTRRSGVGAAVRAGRS